MKKILMTSGAALMLSAGYASADVISFGGDARMGVAYDNNSENEFRIDSRVRGYFFFDAETDTGLGFGGRIRIGNAGAAQSGDDAAGYGHVYVESEFGRVEVGDVAGAAQAAAGDLYGVGFTGLGFFNEPTYFQRDFNGGLFDEGRNKALYIYDMDAFSFYASTGPIDSVFSTYAVGASYDMGMFAVGAGFEYAEADGEANVGDDFLPAGLQRAIGGEGDDIDVIFDGEDATHLTASVEGNFDMFSVKGHYGRAGGDLGDFLDDSGLSQNQFGASVQATFDAYTVSGFARRDFFKDDHFGVNARYDLGGGARIDAGLRRTNYNIDRVRDGEDYSSDTFADIGVNMSF